MKSWGEASQVCNCENYEEEGLEQGIICKKLVASQRGNGGNVHPSFITTTLLGEGRQGYKARMILYSAILLLILGASLVWLCSSDYIKKPAHLQAWTSPNNRTSTRIESDVGSITSQLNDKINVIKSIYNNSLPKYATNSSDMISKPIDASLDTVRHLSDQFRNHRNLQQVKAVCGDGIRQDGEACDDANQVSGDGCSQDCSTVEENWNCMLVTESGPDLCKLNLKYSEPSSTVKLLSYLTILCVIISVCCNIITSFLQSSSRESVFIAINQTQLTLLILLAPVELPIEVMTYLKLLNPFLLSGNFKWNFLRNLQQVLEYEQPNDSVYIIGLHSGSCFINISGCCTVIMIMVTIHIILNCQRICCRHVPRCNLMNSFAMQVAKFLLFHGYLKFILEIFLLLCLSCFTEISRARAVYNENSLSLVLCILTLIVIVSILIVLLYNSLLHMKGIAPRCMDEIFSGFRNTEGCQLYPILFLLRRACLSIVAIWFKDTEMLVFIIIFVFINYLQNLYIIMWKPFPNMVDNLAEIINEMFYICFIAFLLFGYSKEKWPPSVVAIYLTLFQANYAANVIISVVKLAKVLKRRFPGSQIVGRNNRARSMDEPEDENPRVKRSINIYLEPIGDIPEKFTNVVNKQKQILPEEIKESPPQNFVKSRNALYLV
ncbi:unnamed protein product [Moneuplotes crassus]|uniref:Uncharacterized protein n=1 Tax=Euplotes crassus TaxID=5936 RepID=A0AAD1X2A9_EUPCR|nr:unnamed protein product [Moneuplotes crassus]